MESVMNDIPLYEMDVAVRMVGHLLLHHPTYSVSARNQEGLTVGSLSRDAFYWCLTGACSVVAHWLRIDMNRLNWAIHKHIISQTKDCFSNSNFWDNLSHKGREKFALKLSQYGIS